MDEAIRCDRYFADGRRESFTFAELRDIINQMTPGQQSFPAFFEIFGELYGCKEVGVVAEDVPNIGMLNSPGQGFLDPGHPFIRIWDGEDI